jgi:hypothetical protein
VRGAARDSVVRAPGCRRTLSSVGGSTVGEVMDLLVHHLDSKVKPTNQPDGPLKKPNPRYSLRATVTRPFFDNDSVIF